jgi:hypothetical protein
MGKLLLALFLASGLYLWAEQPAAFWPVIDEFLAGVK